MVYKCFKVSAVENTYLLFLLILVKISSEHYGIKLLYILKFFARHMIIFMYKSTLLF